MATHSSILAWRIPWTWEPVGLQSTGPQRVWTRLSNSQFHFHLLSCSNLDLRYTTSTKQLLEGHLPCEHFETFWPVVDLCT